MRHYHTEKVPWLEEDLSYLLPDAYRASMDALLAEARPIISVQDAWRAEPNSIIKLEYGNIKVGTWRTDSFFSFFSRRVCVKP